MCGSCLGARTEREDNKRRGRLLHGHCAGTQTPLVRQGSEKQKATKSLNIGGLKEVSNSIDLGNANYYTLEI